MMNPILKTRSNQQL